MVEGLSDEKLAASLQTDTESSSSLAGAWPPWLSSGSPKAPQRRICQPRLQMLKAKLETCEDSDSDPLERAIALAGTQGPVMPRHCGAVKCMTPSLGLCRGWG